MPREMLLEVLFFPLSSSSSDASDVNCSSIIFSDCTSHITSSSKHMCSWNDTLVADPSHLWLRKVLLRLCHQWFVLKVSSHFWNQFTVVMCGTVPWFHSEILCVQNIYLCECCVMKELWLVIEIFIQVGCSDNVWKTWLFPGLVVGGCSCSFERGNNFHIL